MLVILEAILPCYLKQIQYPLYTREGKTEREIIVQLAVAIKTLVNNCEALAKNYSGPTLRQSPEHKGEFFHGKRQVLPWKGCFLPWKILSFTINKKGDFYQEKSQYLLILMDIFKC